MSSDTTLKYLNLLQLPTVKSAETHAAALGRAHELRKFEIENYWKRSTYFWGFQLVAFAALALAAKDGRFQPPFVIIISVLGILTALAGVLTAGGSKFWQKNWEAHVDYLESAVEGRLHKTVLVDGGLSYSVSKVNRALLQVLCVGWFLSFIAAAAAVLWPGLMELGPTATKFTQIGIPTVVLIAGACRILFGQKSDLKDRAFDRKTLERFPVD